MNDERKEKTLICSIIGFSALTFVSALLSASIIFVYLASFFSTLVVIIGLCAEIMAKLGKWKWATATERFDDGSSLTSVKLAVVGAWGMGVVICVLCLFVIIAMA
ncbi:MAG: hypothetical protein FWG96_02300 [Methanomassiliicoccaceae archaeon]|nr:hypothetical protein [Methanomassiliicoccaceae archaeon]